MKNKTFHASRPCTGTARCPRHKMDPGDIIPFLYLMMLYWFRILDFWTIWLIYIIHIIKSTFDPGDIISSLQTIIAALIFIFKSVQPQCDYYSDCEAFKIWFHTLSCPSSFCPHLSRGILAATKVTVTFCAPEDFHESDGPLNFNSGFWYQMLILWCWLWLWHWHWGAYSSMYTFVSPKKIIGRQTKESVKTSRAPGWTVKERSTTKNDSDNYENNEN